jgi:putative addiction module killer protein
MEPEPRELLIYETKQGAAPLVSWLNSLSDRGARARIKKRLDRAALGNFGNCRFVGGGVFELKINCGPGYRVYFAQFEKLIVLLLCGGDKSTQERDILQAKKFWIDFKQREDADK